MKISHEGSTLTLTAPQCGHSCKEFCTALEFAMQREKETILKYGSLRDQCDYPDIKMMLNELIIQRQKSINLLLETKAHMMMKFDTLNQVREGFEMV